MLNVNIKPQRKYGFIGYVQIHGIRIYACIGTSFTEVLTELYQKTTTLKYIE